MLTLEAKLRQRAARMKRHMADSRLPEYRSDRLDQEPISDPYALDVGEDLYLERLREVHGDRQGKTDP
jgi:hypothetical protein